MEAPTPRLAAEKALENFEGADCIKRLWVIPVEKISLGTQIVEKFAGQSAYDLDLEDYYCNHEEPLLEGAEASLKRLAAMIDESLNSDDLEVQDLYRCDEEDVGMYIPVPSTPLMEDPNG